MISIDYVQDPGHGWLAADVQSLRGLGLLDKVTRFSYRDGDLVWLEEDCDGPAYLRSLSAAGRAYKIIETHTRGDAWIRRLPRFEVTA